jgi:hypothetical protein
MKKIAILLSTLLLAQTSCNSAQAQPDNVVTAGDRLAQANDDGFTLSPQQVRQTAKDITVRLVESTRSWTIERSRDRSLILTQPRFEIWKLSKI